MTCFFFDSAFALSAQGVHREILCRLHSLVVVVLVLVGQLVLLLGEEPFYLLRNSLNKVIIICNYYSHSVFIPILILILILVIRT